MLSAHESFKSTLEVLTPSELNQLIRYKSTPSEGVPEGVQGATGKPGRRPSPPARARRRGIFRVDVALSRRGFAAAAATKGLSDSPLENIWAAPYKHDL